MSDFSLFLFNLTDLCASYNMTPFIILPAPAMAAGDPEHSHVKLHAVKGGCNMLYQETYQAGGDPAKMNLSSVTYVREIPSTPPLILQTICNTMSLLSRCTVIPSMR